MSKNDILIPSLFFESFPELSQVKFLLAGFVQSKPEGRKTAIGEACDSTKLLLTDRVPLRLDPQQWATIRGSTCISDAVLFIIIHIVGLTFLRITREEILFGKRLVVS